MRGDFVFGRGGLTQWLAFRRPGSETEGAPCPIEPADRGIVMGGRGARLQWGSELRCKSTAALSAFNLS